MLADVVPYPPNTGIKIRTFNILRQLNKNGNRVFLVCFNHKILIKDEKAKAQIRLELEKYCSEVHILEIPSEKNRLTHWWALLANFFQTLPYRAHRYYGKECIKIVSDIVGREKIDLVHLDKTEFYILSKYFSGVPIVPTNHNVESRLFKRRVDFELSFFKKVFSWLQFKKTESYEKYVLRKVPLYLTCTDVDSDYFRENLNVSTPSVTIDNGVDASHYHPMGLGKSDYILIIGAQSREATKNYDATVFFMENVWPLVELQNLKVKLKIVGRNPDPTILAYQDKFDNVEVVGFVEDEREFLEKALILAVPLRFGGGSRLKILTAMAQKTCVVSTTIGAEGISCTDGLDVVIANEPGDMANKICDTIKNPEFRKTLEENGRILIENKYDWDIIGDKLEKTYQSLADEQPHD